MSQHCGIHCQALRGNAGTMRLLSPPLQLRLDRHLVQIKPQVVQDSQASNYPCA